MRLRKCRIIEPWRIWYIEAGHQVASKDFQGTARPGQHVIQKLTHLLLPLVRINFIRALRRLQPGIEPAQVQCQPFHFGHACNQNAKGTQVREHPVYFSIRVKVDGGGVDEERKSECAEEVFRGLPKHQVFARRINSCAVENDGQSEVVKSLARHS